jgi:hypothetical protein
VMRTYAIPHNVSSTWHEAGHWISFPPIPVRRTIEATSVKRVAETTACRRGRRISCFTIGSKKLSLVVVQAVNRPWPLSLCWRITPVLDISMSQSAV